MRNGGTLVMRVRRGAVVCWAVVVWGVLAAGFMRAAEEGVGAFPLKSGDVVALMGGANMVRMQEAGYLEVLLSHEFRGAKPRFRDLAWEGDTVFQQTTVKERWRREAFGDLAAQLKRVGATVVMVQFGKMEALTGTSGLERFVEGYGDLLDQIGKQTGRIVLVSPTPYGRTGDRLRPRLEERNDDLALYVEAVRRLAGDRGLRFVDLFGPLRTVYERGQWTLEGLHSIPAGQTLVAATFAGQLGIQVRPWDALESARWAVVEKHRLWYQYWRPANWKCLFGDDSKRIFSIGGRGLPTFQDEWGTYPGLIGAAEEQVWAVLGGARYVAPKPAVVSKGPEGMLSPEEALQTFKATPGFEVNLFASEREGVMNPLSMRWDGRGRMYVVSTMVYPQIVPGASPNDTIVLLEDTDGDGRADKSGVFADGLNIPTGMEVGVDGVYVGQGTELWLLQDTDGDDVADKRTLLLSGFGNGDSHQTVNSFVWSPGGELFFCQGDGIESRVETPHGISSLYQAGVFRLRPRELKLDGLLDDFMGPGNPWGVVFDNWGQALVVDGAGGISHLTPAFLPVHHRLRLPRIGKPGGYCGVDMIGSVGLPAEVQGEFVLGDYKRNRISRFRLVPDGAGFKVDWKESLVESSDRNFRPVDVKVGPDGGVYIADWYNPLTCHQDDFYRHPDRDNLRGRIWRVAPAGGGRAWTSDLGVETVEELVERLGVADRWELQAVKRELGRRPVAAAKRALDRWWGKERDDRALVEALGAYETIHEVAPALIARLLGAEDYRGRAYATRVVGRWHDRLDDPLALLGEMMKDPHPQVRMEAVLACGGIPDARAVEIVARIVDLPTDQWIDYAAIQAVHYLKPHWLPAFNRGELDFGGNSRHLAMVLEKVKLAELAPTLIRLAKKEGMGSEARSSILRGILAVGGTTELRYLLERSTFGEGTSYDVHSHGRLLSELAEASVERGVRPEGDLTVLLRPLMESSDEVVRVAGVRLAGVWGVNGLLPAVMDYARSSGESMAVRRAAVLSLGMLADGEGEAVLLGLTLEPHPGRVRSWAAMAVGRVDLSLGASLAADWVVEERSGRGEVLDGLLSRRGGAGALLKHLERVELSEDGVRWLLRRLESGGHVDSGLKTFLHGKAGVAGGSGYSVERVKELAVGAREKGDAARGELVFQSVTANCYSCHRIAGVGGWIGPDLTAVGSAIPLERIIEEVMWPKRQVKEGYSLVQVTTRDGEVFQGYERKHKDEKDELLLDEFGTGQLRRIPRARIEERQELGSAMPETAVAAMSELQLTDLIRFLSEVGMTRAFSDPNPKAIRNWETLAESTDGFDLRTWLEEGDWVPFYPRINGWMELGDFAGEAQLYLRTPVEVEREEVRRFGLRLTGVGRVWLDAEEMFAGEGGGYAVPLKPGQHWLTVRVDPSRLGRVLALWGE